jgi:2-oxoisovalerate dehydrogenase E2 component (dihydrolipoyl transacylase)
MPQLGESVTEGTVDRWLKQEGDQIQRDEPVVEIVTDKVTAEIPSPFAGILVAINVQAGKTVPVGTELARVEVGAVEPETAPAPEIPSAPGRPAEAETQERRYSPAVRRLAEQEGVDLAELKGSGESGRVTREDVLSVVAARRPHAVAAAVPEAPRGRQELEPLSPMRRSIATHMSRSVAVAPHAWMLQEVDVTTLAAYRRLKKEEFLRQHGVPLTYLPFAIQVVCDGLRAFPHLNASWTEDGILLKRYINLGIPVALPDGLIVPVLRDADRLGLLELARALHDLASRARSKQLSPNEVQDGTFTLNNTGALGSVASQPIINQPQAAILTTEAVTRRPVVVGDGIAIRHMMNMCLTFDHRVLDGFMAGQFLTFIKDRLESWTPGMEP